MNRGKEEKEDQEQLRLGEDEQMALLRRAWRNTVLELLPRVAASSRTFLEQIQPVGLEEGLVHLELRGAFAREWITRRHKREIEEQLGEQLSQKVQIVLVEPAASSLLEGSEPKALVRMPREPSAPPLPRQCLNPRYTFSTYVEGASNRLACAGARAVVQAPGTRYNPLFLYSTPGLGKTHLLHAIGQALWSRDPKARLLYLSAEEFLQNYVKAIREGKSEEFRALHRSVHLWLIDDVEFLGGRERTQEEFFHIFNFLYQSNRQIVLTSDRPPREIIALEERLRSRFEQGLCADIAPPDFELRVAILQKKAELEGITLPDEVIYFIADKVQSNIRALEGALTRLVTYASLYQERITIELAATVLKDYYVEVQPKKVDIDQILDRICEIFSVSKEELVSNSRKGNIVPIRQVAMFLVRELTEEPWTRIAHAFRKHDHTTVIHAHQQVAKRRSQDPHLERMLQEIKKKLYSRE